VTSSTVDYLVPGNEHCIWLGQVQVTGTQCFHFSVCSAGLIFPADGSYGTHSQNIDFTKLSLFLDRAWNSSAPEAIIYFTSIDSFDRDFLENGKSVLK
jgi:hypothetical protein